MKLTLRTGLKHQLRVHMAQVMQGTISLPLCGMMRVDVLPLSTHSRRYTVCQREAIQENYRGGQHTRRYTISTCLKSLLQRMCLIYRSTLFISLL